MAGRKISFSFTVVTGPNAGLTSGPWSVKVNKEDVYIYAQCLGDKWKTSLHGDVAWRTAVTREAQEGPEPIFPVGHDRAPWKYEPPPFRDGRRLAFAIGCQRGALRPGPIGPDGTHVVVNDRWDQIAVVYISMTEAGVELVNVPNAVGRPLPLASGRKVWLQAGIEAVTPGQPEPVPPAAMVESLSAEQGHDVHCPGLLLRGVHFAKPTRTAPE